MKPGKRFYKSPTLVAIGVVLLLGVAVVPTTIALTERQTEQANIRQMDKSEVMELGEDFSSPSVAPKPPTKVPVEKTADSQLPQEQVLIDLQLISVESKSSFLRDRLGVETVGTTLVLSKEQKEWLEDMSLSPASIQWIARPKLLVNDRSTAKLKTTQRIDNQEGVAQDGSPNYELEYDIEITPHVSNKGTIQLELHITLKVQTGADDSGNATITAREIVTQVVVGNGKTLLLELAGGAESKVSDPAKTMFAIITPVVLEPSPQECEELSKIKMSESRQSNQKGKKAVNIETRSLFADKNCLEDIGMGHETVSGNILFLSKKESELKTEATASSGPVDKPTISEARKNIPTGLPSIGGPGFGGGGSGGGFRPDNPADSGSSGL